MKAADAARKPAVAKIGTASDASLIRDAREPIVKHDELVAIRFEDPKTAKPVGVLVQWNCHPESLDSKNTEITADYVLLHGETPARGRRDARSRTSPAPSAAS